MGSKTKWRGVYCTLDSLQAQAAKVQFSSVIQSCPTLGDRMNCSSQASLSITNSRNPPKSMSIEWMMPSNYLILCHPFSSCLQSFPASGSFQMSQLFTSGGQSIGVSASASVLPMNIQGWSPLGWTDWISLQYKLGEMCIWWADNSNYKTLQFLKRKIYAREIVCSFYAHYFAICFSLTETR